MGVLKGILEEERGRLKLVEKGCLREIAKLPAGSIQIYGAHINAPLFAHLNGTFHSQSVLIMQ